MKPSRRLLLIALALSLVASACAPPEDFSGEETAVFVISTAVSVLEVPNQWTLDNDSGCAIEIVISASALAQTTDPILAKALAQWTPVVLPAGVTGVQIDPAVLGPGSNPPITWPFTLKEYIEPDGVADPACAWLPKEVQVTGPGTGGNIVFSVINDQGEFVDK